ncbi:hypothetical protein pEaSNUABM11_00094 [Erwinia phage pEa_SNUABM_11]|nr:hypothetical protein pEaSNUABM11_00094 [Erwinia phage pEa_SNUABM_11]
MTEVKLPNIAHLAYRVDVDGYVLVMKSNKYNDREKWTEIALSAVEADALDTYLNVLKNELSKTEIDYSTVAWRRLVLPSLTIDYTKDEYDSFTTRSKLIATAKEITISKRGGDFEAPWAILNDRRIISNDGNLALIARGNEVVLSCVNYSDVDNTLPPGLDNVVTLLDKIAQLKLVDRADVFLECGAVFRANIGWVDVNSMNYIVEKLKSGK